MDKGKTKIVLLSGGSGLRLWPLCGEARARQFLKVLHDDEGRSESIFMRVLRQIRDSIDHDGIYITAIEDQRDVIRRQGGELLAANIISEPERKGTYPAILLSAAYLMEEGKLEEEDTVLFIPVDPYVETDYFRLVGQLPSALADSGARLGLIGIKPTYPSEKYGYIQTRPDTESSEVSWRWVSSYQEKPGLSEAIALKEAGARWNGGIFCAGGSVLRQQLSEFFCRMGLPEDAGYSRLKEVYASLDHSSFDRQVVEHCDSIVMIAYDGEWKDLGTWNTLTDKMTEPDGGRVLRGEDCYDSHVINELDIPVVALGLKNTVVVASSDGILVSDKHASSYMEPYVEQIHQRPMYEKRQWGEYRVLDQSKCKNGRESTLTKRMVLEKGRAFSYQRHSLREEMWNIIDGQGYFMLDGQVRLVSRGDFIYIKKGQWHGMVTDVGCEIIEVQLGTELVEEDIERQPMDWSQILPKS